MRRGSCANGRDADRGRANRPTSATRGAICPARGTGAALALPYADTEAMQFHLDEIPRLVLARADEVIE
jgi:hypothetical protein